MIDLHSHILPGVDDGALDVEAALAMAEAFVADGVTVVACTPHILPGLYDNAGPAILASISALQSELDARAIPLRLVSGADNYMVPDFIDGLCAGRLLPLNGGRYVLVEPPHHNAPPRFEEFFFELLTRDLVPVLTHPERLSWIRQQYSTIQRLADAGVWMQVTAGSLVGRFGRNARFWAERLLDEGRVHILASDAHDVDRRPPELSFGRRLAAQRVGAIEAENLVFVRPRGILRNVPPSSLPTPERRLLATTLHNEGGGSRRALRISRGLRRIFE